MNYSLISFMPAADSSSSGTAVITVDGCMKNTYIDIPFGIAEGDADWNSLVDSIVNSVLLNMDPQKPTYDPSLVS